MQYEIFFVAFAGAWVALGFVRFAADVVLERSARAQRGHFMDRIFELASEAQRAARLDPYEDIAPQPPCVTCGHAHAMHARDAVGFPLKCRQGECTCAHYQVQRDA